MSDQSGEHSGRDAIESGEFDDSELDQGEFDDSELDQGEFNDSELDDAPLTHLERPTATGDPRVDDAIARLDDLDHAPTADHVTIVDDAHRRLQSALGDLDASVHGGP